MARSKYRIAVVRPQGYLHSSCFREVAEGIRSGLRSLGHEAELGENQIDSSATNILFGAHLLREQELAGLPASTVIFNLEHLGSAPLPSWYLGLASRFQIWDSSAANLERWRQVACASPPALVEIGFAPELRRIPLNRARDIDVLFYGSVTERRSKVLRRLEDSGIKVHSAFGVYGRERDELIARSKVVLNLHANGEDALEIVRISYLLANAKAVVTEASPDIGALSDAMLVCRYDGLVEGCKALVADRAARRALEARGFRAFSARSQARILQKVVGAAAPVAAPVAAARTAGESTVSGLRRLYLDMVERCVINTIYEDPSQDLWHPRIYDSKVRELGRDWPAQAHSMIGRRRMRNLREIAELVLLQGIPGDFIETGVWRGGACILMRAVLLAYGDTERKVWVADSFCGLPPPNPEVAADLRDNLYTYTELFVSSDQVRANFAKYDLLDGQVRFLEGWFSDTLAAAPIERLAILRLDGDMYESTMDALTALYDKVSPGGFIIVDDFGAVEGCQKAILEFRQRRGIQAPLYDIDRYGAFWRKTPQGAPLSEAIVSSALEV
jgi:O-methyltransferase/8-demethyl-8-(2,3-dimethoxy-alpha-L-rhamnosyl)tetracenomycin-C 4'-O-methyltransferase